MNSNTCRRTSGYSFVIRDKDDPGLNGQLAFAAPPASPPAGLHAGARQSPVHTVTQMELVRPCVTFISNCVVLCVHLLSVSFRCI